jgi:hypothetical protein
MIEYANRISHPFSDTMGQQPEFAVTGARRAGKSQLGKSADDLQK